MVDKKDLFLVWNKHSSVNEKMKCFVSFFIMLFAIGLFYTGCASVTELSDDTMRAYGIGINNLEDLKNFQYYISKDMVLRRTNVTTSANIGSGLGRSSTLIEEGKINFVSSSRGEALEVMESDGLVKIGVAFEEDNDYLLWFERDLYDDGEPFFLLIGRYDDNGDFVIDYEGTEYIVYPEKASGITSTFKRVTTSSKKSEIADYYTYPILLIQENKKIKETKSSRTVGGRKLKT